MLPFLIAYHRTNQIIFLILTIYFICCSSLVRLLKIQTPTPYLCNNVIICTCELGVGEAVQRSPGALAASTLLLLGQIFDVSAAKFTLSSIFQPFRPHPRPSHPHHPLHQRIYVWGQLKFVSWELGVGVWRMLSSCLVACSGSKMRALAPILASGEGKKAINNNQLERICSFNALFGL